MKFIPLKLKILGLFLTLLVLVLGSSLWIVSTDQTSAIESTIRSQLEVARDVFRSTLNGRKEKLAVAVELLGKDFAFKRTIATRDPNTIASNAVSLKERIAADVVWVADERGRLFADTSGGLKPGQSLADFPAVSKALEGRPSTAIQLLSGQPYQITAAPLTAPDVIGVLAAGFKLDDGVAREIKRLTLSEVSFQSGGKIFASTLNPDGRSRLEKALPGLAPDSASRFGDPGRTAIALPAQISPEVAVVLQRSWDEALEPLRRLQRILFAIGLAGFALMAVLGFIIADGVTAPIGRLLAATKRLAEGNYRVQVDIGQRDEVGQLGKSFNRMVVGLQEREKIRSVLNKAVSKEIADEMLKRGQLNLGGEEKVVTVLFCDIRNFTGISEGLAPSELVSQLNAYFTSMARVIHSHKGVIDKYIGDAIMALFGAPIDSPEDPSRALQAALAMAAALGQLNAERLARGLGAWQIGLGLNTGRAVVGNLGSDNRLSYTVIGDSVNLASRLEGLTKHYGVPILVSQFTKGAARGDFLYRSIDLVRVKGRQEAVDIFELLGEKVPSPPWLDRFEEGVRAYRRAEFPLAKARFSEVLATVPNDSTSQEYLRRIERFGAAVPSEWDPAHTMQEK